LTWFQHLENHWALVKANFRLVTLRNLLLAIAYLAVIPFFQGVKSLDPIASALCLENYVALVGCILLVPITGPEEDSSINEVVGVKPLPQSRAHILRIITGIGAILALIGCFALFLQQSGCDFPVAKYLIGTFGSALFLGSLGAVTSVLTGSTIIGYLLSIGYLVLNMMGRQRLGVFSILSMSYGSFTEKYYLLGGSVAMLLLVIYSKKLQRL